MKKRVLTKSSDGRWRKQINGKMKYFGKVIPKAEARSYRDAEKRYFQFLDDRERNNGVETSILNLTIAEFAEKYLESEYARYARGEITAVWFEAVRCHISDFVERVNWNKPLRYLSELDLEKYRNEVLLLPKSEKTGRKISTHTARARLSTVKQMVKWGFQIKLIETLPRNLDGYSKVRHPATGVTTYSREEIQLLYMNANNRTKCWILLALNCGYGQKDIADLRVEEVNLVHGRIRRKRSKTGVETNHKLWPKTVELLRETGRFEAGPDERVFLSRFGKPLVQEEYRNDKLRRSDGIRTMFEKLRKRVGLQTGRGFYTLRKTAATEIERIDPTVTEMFLGHVERGMKKHYAGRDWERLDAAVDRMDCFIDRGPNRPQTGQQTDQKVSSSPSS